MESCIFFVSFAPKYCAITTPAPVDNPIKNPTNILMMEVDCPTAARACELTKFPTTYESTVLYNCWNKFPTNNGKENINIDFHMLPFNKSVLSNAFTLPKRKCRIPYWSST